MYFTLLPVLGLLMLSLGEVRADLIYETDFENFPLGDETIRGTDGWSGTHTNLKLYGIAPEVTTNAIQGHAVEGLKNAAFIGSNSAPLPTAVSDTVIVFRRYDVDPVLTNREVMSFSVLLGFSDSTGLTAVTPRDNFQFSIYNNASPSARLATIQMDNATLSPLAPEPLRNIYRTAGAGLALTNTNVTFLYDTVQVLGVRVNFKTNRWSAYLGELAIFENQIFHQAGRALTLGSISAEMVIKRSALSQRFPGDNYMLFDDWSVSLDPLSKLQVESFSRAPRPLLSWASEPGYSYQVQYADVLTGPWLNNLTGSKQTATAGGFMSYTDPTATLPTRRFYRVVPSFP